MKDVIKTLNEMRDKVLAEQNKYIDTHEDDSYRPPNFQYIVNQFDEVWANISDAIEDIIDLNKVL